MTRTTDERDLAAILGANARAARRALGLTQENTAEKIGISAYFYGRMERGHALPSVMTLRRMSLVLKTSIDALLSQRDPRYLN